MKMVKKYIVRPKVESRCCFVIDERKTLLKPKGWITKSVLCFDVAGKAI